jgi:hypothetical protein
VINVKSENFFINNKQSADSLRLYPAQIATQSFGNLRVRCTTQDLTPIENATISISYPGVQNSVIEQMTTDANGLTEFIPLAAPPIEYSLEPATEQPYSVYDINISAPGYEREVIADAEILPNTFSEQNAALTLPEPEAQLGGALFVIPPHTLYGEYPPKIPEDEVKTIPETGEIVLRQVVIPEYVIVHDGPPASNAANYWIRFRDYIKNVACSEIYATWPEASIYANILAILSFTLNRVYTEWYRSQGYPFTITSSTAYDHKWMNRRNIYNNISFLVDSVFVNYLSRPGILQPILTQYCDGNRVTCPDWMSQWGSKYLGDSGLSAIEILRNYYGSSIYINTATEVSGVPSSWPGYNLTIGSRGENVRIIQKQLNRISQSYPAIPRLAVDGIYGPNTARSVNTFQSIFNLAQTSTVDIATWYKISFIYVAVTRLAQ